MYHAGHGPAHFHFEYQGHEALVVIETGEILAGHLPGRALRLVREWSEQHRAELRANWKRAQKTGNGRRISNHWNGLPERTMIKLVSVKARGAKALRLTFSDGSEGDFDFASILARDTVLTRPLEKPDYFDRYFLELGALCWPNGLEFSAGSLHEKLKDAGALRHHATA